MGRKEVKSKKELIDHLIKMMADIVDEHEKTSQKLKNVMHLMSLVVNDADINPGEADVQMDQDVEYDNDDPDCREVEEVVFRKGDTVELWDSTKKRWSGQTGKIEKFCEIMAKIKSGKKTTKRKYGNFRHLLDSGL